MKKQPKKSHRLPHGEGSFYWDQGAGVWRGAIVAGWNDRGKVIRLTASSKDETTAWNKLLAKRKKFLTEGRAAASQRNITLKAWVEKWLAVQVTEQRPRTYAGTASYMTKWVIPTIGAVQLADLTADDIRKVTRKIIRNGRSTTTAGTIQGVLQKCLRDARADGYEIPEPPLMVKKPPKSESERTSLAIPHALAIIERAADRTVTPDGARWVAALLQGMRQGEVLGLTWSCVDFGAKTIDVSWQLDTLPYNTRYDRESGFRVPDGYDAKQLSGSYHLVRPKSQAGRRIIPMVPWLEAALRDWREVSPLNEFDLVWPRSGGLMPRNEKDDFAAWRRIQDDAKAWKSGDGPIYYDMHEARHTTATLLLMAGVDEKVIIQIMGHAKIATTRQYQHVETRMMAEALGKVAERLGLPSA